MGKRCNSKCKPRHAHDESSKLHLVRDRLVKPLFVVKEVRYETKAPPYFFILKILRESSLVMHFILFV